MSNPDRAYKGLKGRYEEVKTWQERSIKSPKTMHRLEETPIET